MLFLSEVISYFYYWYFISFWNDYAGTSRYFTLPTESDVCDVNARDFGVCQSSVSISQSRTYRIYCTYFSDDLHSKFYYP